MKKNKKWLLRIIPSITLATSVMSIVSCSKSDDGSTLLKEIKVRKKIGSYKLVIPSDVRNLKIAIVGSGPSSSKTDGSFMQSIYEAVESFYKKIGVTNPNVAFIKPLETTSAALKVAYATAFRNNHIIIAAGNQHTTPLSDPNYNPPAGKGFIVNGADVKRPWVASTLSRIYETTFLAGIAAGIYLNKNKETFYKDNHLKAGAFGGQDVPIIPQFISGFQNGIKYYNDHFKKDGDHEVEWIDLGKREDYFSGSWAPGGGTAISNKLMSKGADIILPVAGGQAKDVIQAIKTHKAKTLIIGVDLPMEDNPFYQINGRNKHVIFSIAEDITKKLEYMLNILIKKGNVNVKNIFGMGELSIATSENKLVILTSTLNSLVSKTNSPDIYKIIDSKEVIKAATDNEQTLLWDI